MKIEGTRRDENLYKALRDDRFIFPWGRFILLEKLLCTSAGYLRMRLVLQSRHAQEIPSVLHAELGAPAF